MAMVSTINLQDGVVSNFYFIMNNIFSKYDLSLLKNIINIQKIG